MAQQLPPDANALATVTAFQDLPAVALEWLARTGQLCQYADGELIMPAGSPADRLLAVVAGAVQYYAPRDGGQLPVFRVEAGNVSGVLPYSRLQTAKGESYAVRTTTLYFLPRTQFATLEQVSPELVQRLVSLMNDRARDEVRGQERDERLRALGKLAAGLAHELNNPAAAITRAADALQQSVSRKPAFVRDLLLTAPPAEAMAALLAAPLPPPPAPTSALARADAEDELANWLEDQGCTDGFDLAPGLLEAGHSAATLGPLLAPLPAPARPPALAWLASQMASLRLAQDVREAGQRISTLVGNIKTYSHMDRGAAPEPLDVTTGLDSTLKIFAYAVRQKQVQLTRTYAPGLPLVPGRAGQLNQVWTNLLDNALDALPDHGGTLGVQAAPQGGGVCVSITDNGSGIAPDVLAHMFEPFYTTKPAGEGSGLGLDIARRIVQEHGGRLQAQSVPGRTEFTVWLPA